MGRWLAGRQAVGRQWAGRKGTGSEKASEQEGRGRLWQFLSTCCSHDCVSVAPNPLDLALSTQAEHLPNFLVTLSKINPKVPVTPSPTKPELHFLNNLGSKTSANKPSARFSYPPQDSKPPPTCSSAAFVSAA